MMTAMNTTQTAHDTTQERLRQPLRCPACNEPVEAPQSADVDEFPCPHCKAPIPASQTGIVEGMVIDDFHLIRRLGRGAMGEVFLARQRSLSRMVAIKVLASGMTSSSKQISWFQREVQNLARLQHPNIITAFYAGVHEQSQYVAMSHVDGEDLRDRIQRRGMMGEEEALSVAYKVADALRYAWEEHGLLHRDIKPANIMIDAHGEVKLTDLGISKCVYDESEERQGQRISGTPIYMSPEQARGDADIDFRSDMYSLGITLYHMLTGAPPFDETEVTAILNRQRFEHPPPIENARPDLSPGTRALQQRLLSKLPNGRYDSWDALLYALSEALTQRPALGAAGIRSGYETQEVWLDKPLRQRRWKRVAMGLSALLATVLAGPATWQWMQIEPPERSLRTVTQETADALRNTPQGLAHAVNVIGDTASQAMGAIETAYTNWSLRRIERERRQRVSEVLEHLDQRANQHLRDGRPDKAASVYTEYDGPWAKESFEARRERAGAYYSRRLPRKPEEKANDPIDSTEP